MEVTRENLIDVIGPAAIKLADYDEVESATALINVHLYITALEYAVDRADAWPYFEQARIYIAKRKRERGLK